METAYKELIYVHDEVGEIDSFPRTSLLPKMPQERFTSLSIEGNTVK